MFKLYFDGSHSAKQAIFANYQLAERLLCDTKAKWVSFSFAQTGILFIYLCVYFFVFFEAKAHNIANV